MKIITVIILLMSLSAFSNVGGEIEENDHGKSLLSESFKMQGISDNVNFPRLRFGFNVGYSYASGEDDEDLPSVLKDYSDELRSGYHFGADAAFFITESVGIGLKYHLFKTSNKLSDIYVTDEFGNVLYGDMSDDIAVSFIAPTIYFRHIAQRRHLLYVNIAMGSMSYNNDFEIVGKYTAKGTSIGFMYDLGYDFLLNEQLAIGFQVSYFMGALIEYEVSDGTQIQTFDANDDDVTGINANHLNLSVGLRYYL